MTMKTDILKPFVLFPHFKLLKSQSFLSPFPETFARYITMKSEEVSLYCLKNVNLVEIRRVNNVMEVFTSIKVFIIDYPKVSRKMIYLWLPSTKVHKIILAAILHKNILDKFKTLFFCQTALYSLKESDTSAK
jgi:hypothetical protein